jgi:sugar lactone lactonase YvrE
MVDYDLGTLADGAAAELTLPSGLALYDGHLYVADNETSRITAFTLSGERVDWLDTGLNPGSLMGIEFDAQGRLYAVDGLGSRLLRITAK